MPNHPGAVRKCMRLLGVSCVVLLAGTALAGTAVEEPDTVVSLAGTWRFQLDRDDAGIADTWFETELHERIDLPGSTAENGFGDDVSVDTQWTGGIIDRSWFTDDAYANYREPGSVKVPFWLTPVKHYVGAAWYQRDVTVPDRWAGKRVLLSLERCHWETQVWVDGTQMGMRNSLSTPHEYDLTGAMSPGTHCLTIRVDNTVKIDVGENAHSVSDHTQSNWNGITGRIQVTATDPVWIEDIQVYPDVGNRRARVIVTLGNATGHEASARITVAARTVHSDNPHETPERTVACDVAPAGTDVDVVYEMGENVLLWDEFSPNVYELAVSVETEKSRDRRSVQFGMREMGTNGTQVAINGQTRFVRGTLECCIFPRTGYPPMDAGEWLRNMGVAKAHGLNHLRFHSWCPPEAAFQAADRLGFTFQVECPAWATVGDGKPIDAFIYAEGDRILKAYGNHPSFAMLAYGNEPGGRKHRRFLAKLVEYWKAKDPRRLYTSAAGWPIIPENDYHSTPGPRAQQWGAELEGRFNAGPLSTEVDYSKDIADYPVPVISHEIGQWCVYPNFKEIDKYTGVLRARNFEIFRDTLRENHMLDQAEDFLMASGKLQTLLYKEEIEAALRTSGFGGFQLLDIHDFPGQGTALVGMLDPFWESKGYVTPEEFHRFCSETVPLLRMPKVTWTTGETFSATIEIAHYGPAPISDAVTVWRVENVDSAAVVASATLSPRTIPAGELTGLGELGFPLADVDAPARLVVTVALANTPYENSWDIWVYPSLLDITPPGDVLISEELDENALDTLRNGGKVILMLRLRTVSSDVPAGFSSIFWNTAWTRRQAPHTLGILCDPAHPALAGFPTQFHSNWQWWEIAAHARAMIIDNMPPDLRPVIQVIDDWVTNRRLAYVFEARVESGSLLLCSIDLRERLDERPVARQMLHSLLRYVGSPDFAPTQQVTVEQIQGLFRKLTLMDRMLLRRTAD